MCGSYSGAEKTPRVGVAGIQEDELDDRPKTVGTLFCLESELQIVPCKYPVNVE